MSAYKIDVGLPSLKLGDPTFVIAALSPPLSPRPLYPVRYDWRVTTTEP